MRGTIIRLPIRILPYAASFGVFFILFQHRNKLKDTVTRRLRVVGFFLF